MSLVLHTIEDLMGTANYNTGKSNLKLTWNDLNNNSVTIPVTYIEPYIELYTQRYFVTMKTNKELAAADFITKWTTYTANANPLKLQQISRLFQAVQDYNYNPTENYDRYEVLYTKFTHGETHTKSGNEEFIHGETHTLSGSDTTSKSTENTETDSEAGMNNYNTYVPASQRKTEGTATKNQDSTLYGRTDTASGTDKRTYNSVKDAASGDDITDTDNHLHGNIGVTTAMDTIKQELDLRFRDILGEFIKTFLDVYTIML